MSFAELQTKFQAGIRNGDQSILASIRDLPGTDRATLFGLLLRLSASSRGIPSERLSNASQFPRRGSIRPPRRRLYRVHILTAVKCAVYGARVPDFMLGIPAWRTNRSAIDLAQFERALSNAFDAADAPIAAMESLQDT